MKRSVITTAVAVVAAFSIGLSWSYFTSSQTGGVAVVDLDEVARRLGQAQEMSESLQTQSGSLQAQLTKVKADAEAQLKKIRDDLGSEPTNEEAQQWVRLAKSAQLQMNQLQQRASVSLNQHRQKLISDFRKQTQPIAAKIAKEKGFDTIVTRNDTVVFSYDNSVDITEDVIKQMSGTYTPVASAPARPAETQAPAKAETATAQGSSDSATK